jgi:hypothetical protein
VHGPNGTYFAGGTSGSRAYSPICLERLFGKSERVLFWGAKSGQDEPRSVLIAAFRHQKHAIQTRPAIFQTVSRSRVLGNSAAGVGDS